MTPSPTSRSGFTLLEILAAIAILAVVLTALFGLHLQTLSMAADTRFYAVAPLLAQKKMAEIQIEGAEQIRTDSGDFGEAFPRYRWEAEVSDTESIEFEAAAEVLRRIDVKILDDSDQNTYALRTYRYVQPF